MSVIKELTEYFNEIQRLSYISGLLGWDQQVNMMNYKSVQGRSEQKALIKKVMHQRLTSEKAGKLIKKAENLKDLTDIDSAMVLAIYSKPRDVMRQL